MGNPLLDFIDDIIYCVISDVSVLHALVPLNSTLNLVIDTYASPTYSE